MLLIISTAFSIILFLFGLYLSMKKPKLLLKVKRGFGTALIVSFMINVSFLAGYDSSQKDLIGSGLLSNPNKIAFEYKALSFIPAILFYIHNSFIIHFAKGKKEGKRELTKESS